MGSKKTAGRNTTRTKKRNKTDVRPNTESETTGNDSGQIRRREKECPMGDKRTAGGQGFEGIGIYTTTAPLGEKGHQKMAGLKKKSFQRGGKGTIREKRCVGFAKKQRVQRDSRHFSAENNKTISPSGPRGGRGVHKGMQCVVSSKSWGKNREPG